MISSCDTCVRLTLCNMVVAYELIQRMEESTGVCTGVSEISRREKLFTKGNELE
jgi:hypothetical protein